MKKCRTWIVVCMLIVLAMGCGNQGSSRKNMDTSSSSVDQVIENQAKKEEQASNEETTQESVETEDDGKVIDAPEANVDVNLAEMNSDMIYATVYQMMSDPEQYIGKTFRIEGTFYTTYDEWTKNHYYYCVIKDATECCAQGLEFVWGDGSHVYPDEYPADGTKVVIDGTFEKYTEDESTYCRLGNASLYL